MVIHPPTHLMDQRISVGVATEAATTGGSVITTFTTSTSTSYAARIWPVSASENVRAGRRASQVVYNVIVSPGATVTAQDRIYWGSKTLRVLGPVQDAGSQGVIIKFEAEDVGD